MSIASPTLKQSRGPERSPSLPSLDPAIPRAMHDRCVDRGLMFPDNCKVRHLRIVGRDRPSWVSDTRSRDARPGGQDGVTIEVPRPGKKILP